jgi:TonB family protein
MTIQRLLLIATTVLIPMSAFAQTGKKDAALYAPFPEYPRNLDNTYDSGEGLFFLLINENTGLVTAVSVLRSTGNWHLDRAAMDALRRWRFRPHTVHKLQVPMTFKNN